MLGKNIKEKLFSELAKLQATLSTTNLYATDINKFFQAREEFTIEMEADALLMSNLIKDTEKFSRHHKIRSLHDYTQYTGLLNDFQKMQTALAKLQLLSLASVEAARATRKVFLKSLESCVREEFHTKETNQELRRNFVFQTPTAIPERQELQAQKQSQAMREAAQEKQKLAQREAAKLAQEQQQKQIAELNVQKQKLTAIENTLQASAKTVAELSNTVKKLATKNGTPSGKAGSLAPIKAAQQVLETTLPRYDSSNINAVKAQITLIENKNVALEQQIKLLTQEKEKLEQQQAKINTPTQNEQKFNCILALQAYIDQREKEANNPLYFIKNNFGKFNAEDKIQCAKQMKEMLESPMTGTWFFLADHHSMRDGRLKKIYEQYKDAFFKVEDFELQKKISLCKDRCPSFDSLTPAEKDFVNDSMRYINALSKKLGTLSDDALNAAQIEFSKKNSIGVPLCQEHQNTIDTFPPNLSNSPKTKKALPTKAPELPNKVSNAVTPFFRAETDAKATKTTQKKQLPIKETALAAEC